MSAPQIDPVALNDLAKSLNESAYRGTLARYGIPTAHVEAMRLAVNEALARRAAKPVFRHLRDDLFEIGTTARVWRESGLPRYAAVYAEAVTHGPRRARVLALACFSRRPQGARDPKAWEALRRQRLELVGWLRDRGYHEAANVVQRVTASPTTFDFSVLSPRR